MFKCKYGHAHRTPRGVEFCHINVPWYEKAGLIKKTSWIKQGNTDEWTDLGEYRDFFWGPMRDRIITRDRTCQYENCTETKHLEVHHIIPRRLGGADHPANLITLCHDHHRIQSSHHYDVGLILCKEDLKIVLAQQIRQKRPINETSLLDFIENDNLKHKS